MSFERYKMKEWSKVHESCFHSSATAEKEGSKVQESCFHSGTLHGAVSTQMKV